MTPPELPPRSRSAVVTKAISRLFVGGPVARGSQLVLTRLLWAVRRSSLALSLGAILAGKTRLVRIRFLQRSGSNYVEIENGQGSFASTYGDWDSARETTEIPSPSPLGLWKIFGGETYAFTKFALVRQNSNLLILPRNESAPYHFYPKTRSGNGFQILRQDENFLLTEIPPRFLSAKACAYVGTRSPTNWSHWLINFLPGVMVARDYFGDKYDPPLIVGPGFRDGEARAALFDYFWPGRSVLELSHLEAARCEEIFWFEQPYSDSPRPSHLESLRPKTANLTTMAAFRRRLLSFAKTQDRGGPLPEKIFLARESGLSRPYNQSDVEEVASDNGYSIVHLNRLPIARQISLLANAERIVGPTGSAFAGTIVAKPGAMLLELATSTKAEKVEDWYAPLASVAGANYWITYGPFRSDRTAGGIWLDPKLVNECLARF